MRTSRLFFLCTLVAAPALGACGPETLEIKFPIQENGRQIEVRKFYGTNELNSPAGNRSFREIQAGRVDQAMATMQSEVASNPGHAYDHYDLAIIYEIKGDWNAAHREILEAERHHGAHNATFVDERAFIERHGGK